MYKIEFYKDTKCKTGIKPLLDERNYTLTIEHDIGCREFPTCKKTLIYLP